MIDASVQLRLNENAEDTSGKQYKILQLLKTITHFQHKISSEWYPKGHMGEGEIAPSGSRHN